MTVVTFIVGVVFLLSGKIRYPHNDTYNVLPVHSMAFSRDLVGSTRATNCLFTLIGTALMVIGLIVRLAVEAGRGKTVNRIIVADIIFMLVTTVAIVFSFITVDYGNAIFLVGAILIACCGVLTIIHMLLSIIKKLICGE